MVSGLCRPGLMWRGLAPSHGGCHEFRSEPYPAGRRFDQWGYHRTHAHTSFCFSCRAKHMFALHFFWRCSRICCSQFVLALMLVLLLLGLSPDAEVMRHNAAHALLVCCWCAPGLEWLSWLNGLDFQCFRSASWSSHSMGVHSLRCFAVRPPFRLLVTIMALFSSFVDSFA